MKNRESDDWCVFERIVVTFCMSCVSVEFLSLICLFIFFLNDQFADLRALFAS